MFMPSDLGEYNSDLFPEFQATEQKSHTACSSQVRFG